MICKIDGCNGGVTRYPEPQICNKHYVRFLKTGSYDHKPAKKFDGSTYRTSTNNNPNSSLTVDDRAKFTLDRDNSVIDRLRTKRAHYDGLKEYVTYAGIRRELEREIDIGDKTITSIVTKHGVAGEMHPHKSIKSPRRVINNEVPDLVIPKDTRRFLTQSWA